MNKVKSPKHKYVALTAKKEVRPYNVITEEEKINSGKVPPINIDRSVFKKTPAEKAALKDLRRKDYPRFVGSVPPLFGANAIPVKTTVHFENVGKDNEFNNTHSIASKNPMLDAQILANALNAKIVRVYTTAGRIYG